MSSPRPSALPLCALLSFAAGPLAAQGRVEVAPVTTAGPGSGGSAAAGASLTGTSATGNQTLSLTPIMGGGLTTFTPSAPSAQSAPNAQPIQSVTPAGTVRPTRTAAPVTAAPVRSRSSVAAPAVVAPTKFLPQGAEAAPTAANAAPAAGAALTGAARGLGEARALEAAGGDGFSVQRALGRVFDAATANSAAIKGGVAGRAQGVREAVAQKVTIANSASPADAPDLYKDAITTAKNALPTALADGVAKVVRGFAARKAEVSLGDLAAAAYEAAAGGSAKETSRLLAGLDKWESLLGAPGRPVVANAEALKSDVRSFLDDKTVASGRSVPHVWFERSGASLVARIPGAAAAPASAVAKVPGLAAGFAIAPASFGPEVALADAYRAFSADPRAASGASLVYRARRALGSSVPGAAVSASRFWLRAAIESVWRRLVALLTGSSSYKLASASGRAAVQRDAVFVRAAGSEASAAAALLASTSLRVAGVRAALGSLTRSAAAFESLTGESHARVMVADLGAAFERGAREQGLSASDALPAGLASLVSSPGGIAHWAGLLRAEAVRAVDARLWNGRGGADFLNLGAERSAAVSESVLVKRFAAAPLAFVALDDMLWAHGRGSFGEVRMSVDLRATDEGGGIRLLAERGDKALARRLESLGLSVYPTRGGMVAVLGYEDLARDASEVGLLAARAAAAAVATPEAVPPAAAALRELLDETRRSPSASAALAAALDGRAVFAAAPVIGLAGEYEAVGPVSTTLDGKPAFVTALRDPDTGLLVYARADISLGR